MAKLWNTPRRIKIYERQTGRKTKTFVADDAHCSSPINTFYLDGKEVNWYDERTHYYRSFEFERGN